MSQKLPNVSYRYFADTNCFSFSLSCMILSMVILRWRLEVAGGTCVTGGGSTPSWGVSFERGWMSMNFMQQQNSQMVVSFTPSSLSKKLLILALKSAGMTTVRLFWSSKFILALMSLSFMLLMRLLKLRMVSLQNRSVFMRFTEERLEFSSFRSSVILRISFGRQQFRIQWKPFSYSLLSLLSFLSLLSLPCSSSCSSNAFSLPRLAVQSISPSGFLAKWVILFSQQITNQFLKCWVQRVARESSLMRWFSFCTRESPLAFLTTRRRLAMRLSSLCLMDSPLTSSSSFLQISSRMISRFFSKGLQQRKARVVWKGWRLFMTAQKVMQSSLQKCSDWSRCSFFCTFTQKRKRERMPAEVTNCRSSLRLKLESQSSSGSKYSKWLLVSERLRMTSGSSSGLGLNSLEEEYSEERELSMREGWLLTLMLAFSMRGISSSWTSLRRKVLRRASWLSLTHSRTRSSCYCSTTSSLESIVFAMQCVTGSIFSYCQRLLSFLEMAYCRGTSSANSSSSSTVLIALFTDCLRIQFGLRTIKDSQLKEIGAISSIWSITFVLLSWKSLTRFLSVIFNGFFLSFWSVLLNLVRSTGRKVVLSSLLLGLYLEMLADRAWMDFTKGFFEFLSQLSSVFFSCTATVISF